jgi:hypothetical protein
MTKIIKKPVGLRRTIGLSAGVSVILGMIIGWLSLTFFYGLVVAVYFLATIYFEFFYVCIYF